RAAGSAPAGPTGPVPGRTLSCGADSANRLRPLLAGQTARAGGPAGTDPYAAGSPTALCGTLAADAQPKV
ncbi:hypothetical protein ABTX35_25795, partial [Streptomyces sp. NPDC096080]